MKSKRHSVERIVAAVNKHELRTPLADSSHKLAIAEQTVHRLKKQCAGLEASVAREVE